MLDLIIGSLIVLALIFCIIGVLYFFKHPENKKIINETYNKKIIYL